MPRCSRAKVGSAMPTAKACLPAVSRRSSQSAPKGPKHGILDIGRTPLLVDDVNVFMQAGDSVLGRALDKIGGWGTARKVRQAVNDDLEASADGATLDAAFEELIPRFMQFRENVCTATCNEQGRATKDAPGMVTAYKRCMVDADSTAEARKLNAYERDLYCDTFKKADARCRTSISATGSRVTLSCVASMRARVSTSAACETHEPSGSRGCRRHSCGVRRDRLTSPSPLDTRPNRRRRRLPRSSRSG